MNSIVGSMIATASLIISGFALAVDMPAEGKAKCGTCHAIDKNIFVRLLWQCPKNTRMTKTPQAKSLLTLP